jgi:hypothetical protein
LALFDHQLFPRKLLLLLLSSPLPFSRHIPRDIQVRAESQTRVTKKEGLV